MTVERPEIPLPEMIAQFKQMIRQEGGFDYFDAFYAYVKRLGVPDRQLFSPLPGEKRGHWIQRRGKWTDEQLSASERAQHVTALRWVNEGRVTAEDIQSYEQCHNSCRDEHEHWHHCREREVP